jgi:hypothetical protein
VTENPGLGQQGVYYYHQTFAKALSAMKVDQFEDSTGKKHDWRKELAEHLLNTQSKNGSWVNANDRWYEGDPNLATAYVLMALKYCEPRSLVSMALLPSPPGRGVGGEGSLHPAEPPANRPPRAARRQPAEYSYPTAKIRPSGAGQGRLSLCERAPSPSRRVMSGDPSCE